MTTPFDTLTFLFIWLGFLLLMSSGVLVFFMWGIRSKQFGNQDRARYLALEARVPSLEEWKNSTAAKPGSRQP